MSVPSPSSKQARGIAITVGVLVFVMVLFVSLFFYKLMTPRVLSHEELLANGAVEFEIARVIAPFELVDQHGETFTLERLKDKWTLVFFGFASCPDICPTTLAVLSRMMASLDDDVREQTQVVLVTVDPQRDTPEKLATYVSHFHPDFIGLSGELTSIHELAEQLYISFNRVGSGDDYSVDHSGQLILINPYGHYHGFFKPPFELARLKLTYQSMVSSFDPE